MRRACARASSCATVSAATAAPTAAVIRRVKATGGLASQVCSSSNEIDDLIPAGTKQVTHIEIRGARTRNLKGIDVDVPKGRPAVEPPPGARCSASSDGTQWWS